MECDPNHILANMPKLLEVFKFVLSYLVEKRDVA